MDKKKGKVKKKIKLDKKQEDLIRKIYDKVDLDALSQIVGVEKKQIKKFIKKSKLDKQIYQKTIEKLADKCQETLMDRHVDSLVDLTDMFKVSKNQIHDALESIEDKRGILIEKDRSGYFINVRREPQDDIFNYKLAKTEKIAFMGDTQLGSKCQQLTHLKKFYDRCANEGVKRVFHTGDLVEGNKVYRGQEYEVFLHGSDEQKDYAVNNYPYKKGIETWAISGNHDLAFFTTSGIDIVSAIAKERSDIKYLGQYGAYVHLSEKCRLYLHHPEKGGAYARSYKIQKFVEGFSSENKPNIAAYGHYHVMEYLFLRNIYNFQTGCYQSQTSYLKRKGLHPEIGGWIIELKLQDDGTINSCKAEWIPVFKPIKDDY